MSVEHKKMDVVDGESSSQLEGQQLTYMTTVFQAPSKYSSVHMISAVALGRWLNVNEIEHLLNHEQRILPLSTAPPSTPPPSGTLLLYDRSMTRNYKDDGHQWIKKRNSHKVREDHVKLRVGGKFRVSGCYVHSNNMPSFHRRAYHLLCPDTGTALYPVTSASKNKNRIPSLVLVHYLDTKIAGNHCSSLIRQGIEVSQSFLKGHEEYDEEEYECDYDERPQAVTSSGGYHETQYEEVQLVTGSNFEASLDNNTLDFLWDVVLEEGSEDVNMNSADLSALLHPHMIEKLLNTEGLLEDGSVVDFDQSEVDLKALAETLQVLKTDASEKGQEMEYTIEIEDVNADGSDERSSGKMLSSVINSSKIMFGAQSDIPQSVDITPETIDVSSHSAKIVLSASGLVPSIPTDGQDKVWHRVLAFAHITNKSGSKETQVDVSRLQDMKLLNPYTMQCTLPIRSLQTGKYQILALGLCLSWGASISHKDVRTEVGFLLSNAISLSPNGFEVVKQRHTVSSEHISIKILSQPCHTLLTCVGATNEHPEESCASINSSSVTEHILHELPAPPPAMALVATILQDFPNPPSEAVFPLNSDETIEDIINEGATIAEAKESNPIESSALLETHKRKHSQSFVADNLGAAAEEWALNVSEAKNADTKGEELDRHCKIRFVERLTSIIAETGASSSLKSRLPSEIIAEESSTHGDAILIDSNEMRALNDGKLDHIVDTLLVQIVECLVDMNSNDSDDVKAELNEPDKSGFCLLHYASLYNLQSLIPVLLSKGANPNVVTLRGNLTALHLACSAGNAAIAELLLRHGCAEDVTDVFGMRPADHAERNGFTELAAMLRMRYPQENNIAMDVDTTNYDSDDRRYRLQQAFANLSLKDKMILNLLVEKQKYKRESFKPTIEKVVEEELTDDSSDDRDTSASTLSRSTKNESLGAVKDELAAVLFDGNKDNLDMAMKLMNEEERSKLEDQSIGVHEGINEWLMRRNYETLQEANEHLKKTMEERKKSKAVEDDHQDDNSSDSTGSSKKQNQTAAIRALKNMKNHALAQLVIRKDMKKGESAKP